ncbi:MAG: class B sortase [Oscillospiraceae bacterium]|nr:class B sortase [Oscillospiraceae bacterium]
MRAKRIGKKTISIANMIINNTVLIAIVVLVAFATYALWDSKQLHQTADKSNYAAYRPTEEDEGKSFKELQEINSEVIAWLTVYGTNIDYPMTQGPDNMKYVNTSAEGYYSLSGAIFLDYNNNKDFSDFNSIIYGHHMAKKVMFGEIGEFADKDMFDSHEYGNLYVNEKDYEIEFFAFLHVNAYDSTVFYANVRDEDREAYLENLLEKAMYIRDIGVTIDDRIILLSTCSDNSTNGRDILVGRLREKVIDETIIDTKDDNDSENDNTEINNEDSEDSQAYIASDNPQSSLGIQLFPIIFTAVLMVVLAVISRVVYNKRKDGRNNEKTKNNEN